MEKILPSSSWNYKPLPKQIRAIVKLAKQLGITEHIENGPTNRWEARNLIYDLRKERDRRHGTNTTIPT